MGVPQAIANTEAQMRSGEWTHGRYSSKRQAGILLATPALASLDSTAGLPPAAGTLARDAWAAVPVYA